MIREYKYRGVFGINPNSNKLIFLNKDNLLPLNHNDRKLKRKGNLFMYLITGFLNENRVRMVCNIFCTILCNITNILYITNNIY